VRFTTVKACAPIRLSAMRIVIVIARAACQPRSAADPGVARGLGPEHWRDRLRQRFIVG